MNIGDRIENLRIRMREENVDMYFIPTNDYHSSEYVGDYFKCREYISGFTGSAGTVIVTMAEAGLWTDGRYFLQAEDQLKGTDIILHRSGEEDVLKPSEYIEKNIENGQVVGFDGRTVSAKWAEELKEKLDKKGAGLRGSLDLVGDIWADRPVLKSDKVWLLDEKYAGESRDSKIERLREYMDEKGDDYHIITSLDDIAWLLNIRGNDIHCNPVVMSYLVVSQSEIILFADETSFSEQVKEELSKSGVTYKSYDDIYDYVKDIKPLERIMLDKNVVNYAIIENISKDAVIDEQVNPTILWKAKKNQTEVDNEKKAHIKDGVAVTKFIYWLKKNMGKIRMTELSVTEKLESIRSAGENYIGPSFDTIAGFAEHGAIVHYSATEETDKEIIPDGLLLVDTGGHYLEGTTDITRTILIGDNATDEQKMFYTAVLRGNLSLCAAKFKSGCSGVALDYLARKPLWDMGCDFNHGTGHGVGYLLNVHESPNAFRYRIIDTPGENAVLEEGMITSDEPGIYLAGKFGIRLENLIVCVKREKNEYGQFLGFEPLTYVPFDRSLIDTEGMNKEEIELLNEYHKKVYENISPYLTEEERVWLGRECEKISDVGNK